MIRAHQDATIHLPEAQNPIRAGLINRVVYTIQQSTGCIGDSFEGANETRRRVGLAFEAFVRLLMKTVGVTCAKKTVNIPIPGFPGRKMSYELDLVFSRVPIASAEATEVFHSSEVVGSVKTTSKDRIDKLFLDKFLLTKLLGRDIPVVAIFLHDVQRKTTKLTRYSIAATFKTNHFLGYAVALNPLDGVYYVDPRPEMVSNKLLAEQIRDFQSFLVNDLWVLLSKPT